MVEVWGELSQRFSNLRDEMGSLFIEELAPTAIFPVHGLFWSTQRIPSVSPSKSFGQPDVQTLKSMSQMIARRS